MLPNCVQLSTLPFDSSTCVVCILCPETEPRSFACRNLMSSRDPQASCGQFPDFCSGYPPIIRTCFTGTANNQRRGQNDWLAIVLPRFLSSAAQEKQSKGLMTVSLEELYYCTLSQEEGHWMPALCWGLMETSISPWTATSEPSQDSRPTKKQNQASQAPGKASAPAKSTHLQLIPGQSTIATRFKRPGCSSAPRLFGAHLRVNLGLLETSLVLLGPTRSFAVISWVILFAFSPSVCSSAPQLDQQRRSHPGHSRLVCFHACASSYQPSLTLKTALPGSLSAAALDCPPICCLCALSWNYRPVKMSSI